MEQEKFNEASDPRRLREQQEKLEALEAERESVRITDKRKQGKPAPQVENAPAGESAMSPEELREQMAAQGMAAEQEQAGQPAFECATFVILTLDRMGNMRVWNQMAEISAMQSQGIGVDRDATNNDLINMHAQLGLVVTGNEISSRVIQALAIQAQMAAQQRGAPVPVNGMGGVDPRIQRAARGGV